MSGAVSALPRVDLTRIIAAVLFVISTFLPVAGVSVSVAGYKVSASADAWHSFATVGVLISLLAIAVWAVRRFSSVELPEIPRGWDFAVPVAMAVGLVIIVLREITWGHGIGVRWGFFVLLIAGIAFIAADWIAERTSQSRTV